MKKIILIALVAMVSLCSCEREYTKDLAGTNWLGSFHIEGSFQGAPTDAGIDCTLRFLPDAQGHINIHFVSLVDGQPVADETHDNDFTFTYDSRNGVITTIPGEGEEETRYMFHTYGDTLLTIDMKYNALNFPLQFRKY